MRLSSMSQVFGLLGTVCATISLVCPINSTPAKADGCESLCSEAFWREATPDDVAVALAQGAEINVQDQDGASPLHWAAGYGREPAVEALLASGADVHARSYIGFRPLHWWAIWNGDSAVLETMMAAGANVHVRDGLGITPLHEAAESPNLLSVTALLKAGANVNARGIGGGGPLLMAAYRGRVEVVEVLLAAGADVNQRGGAFAHSEWERGNVTPLHMTASALVDYVPSEAAQRVAELLLDHGADVNAEDLYDRTPLDDAIDEGHVAMQILLRRHGGRCQKSC